MNKDFILKKLNESNLDKNRIIVISGASLVCQGIIKETNEYYDNLNWKTRIGAYGIEIKYNDVFEISYNLHFPENIIYINGYRFMDVPKCLEIKKELNREEDKEMIKLIELYIKGSDCNG